MRCFYWNIFNIFSNIFCLQGNHNISVKIEHLSKVSRGHIYTLKVIFFNAALEKSFRTPDDQIIPKYLL